MSESKLLNMSMDFSVSVLKLCETIKGHYSLTNQLERSATSIGANIREANYAHGKADFIAKLQMLIALNQSITLAVQFAVCLFHQSTPPRRTLNAG